MHNSKNRLIFSAIMAGLCSAFGADYGARTIIPQSRAVRPHKPARRRWFAGNRSSNIAHQGARECARRRGGQDWLDFRAADRVRRGLPVSWPYQRGEA